MKQALHGFHYIFNSLKKNLTEQETTVLISKTSKMGFLVSRQKT